MYHHGISLMPTAIDPELSRGHPLFYHAIAAIWMNVFGPSLFSMHSFALLISVLFLIAIYESGIRLFNQRVAVLSLLLTATLTVFFIQSSFVLFEVLIAFLCFLSIVFYVSEKYFLAAICLTAVFYTKESGLMVGFVIGIDALISLFNRGIDIRIRIRRFLSIAIPCLLIGIFFLLQKHVRGWYIFPLYNDLIEHNWGAFWYNFRRNCVRNTFDDFNKYYYFIVLLVVVLTTAIKNKNVKYLAPFLPASIIYLIVDDRRGGEVYFSGLLMFLLIATVVCMFYAFRSLKIYADNRQQRLLVLSGVFIFVFLCFSSLNFFTYRYLLAAIIPLFFFTSVIIDKYLDRSYRVLYYPILIIILCISGYAYWSDDNFGDSNPGAFDGLDVQQKEIDFMIRNNFYDKSIGVGSFLTHEHLIDPATGFLHGEKPFDKNRVRWELDPSTDIILFNNLEPDNRYNSFTKEKNIHLIYRYAKGKAWTEIYERK